MPITRAMSFEASTKRKLNVSSQIGGCRCPANCPCPSRRQVEWPISCIRPVESSAHCTNERPIAADICVRRAFRKHGVSLSPVSPLHGLVVITSACLHGAVAVLEGCRALLRDTTVITVLPVDTEIVSVLGNKDDEIVT